MTATPYTAEQAAELDTVIKFLMGEGELAGVWFGDKPDSERGNFWWRKHLRAALEKAGLRDNEVEQQSAPEGIPGGNERSDTGVAGDDEYPNEAAIKRMVHDFPILSEFYYKYAIGCKWPVAPSCLCCGQPTEPEDVAVKHAELADIFVCSRCKLASQSHPSASADRADSARTGDTLKQAISLLEQSAAPFDKACMLLRQVKDKAALSSFPIPESASNSDALAPPDAKAALEELVREAVNRFRSSILQWAGQEADDVGYVEVSFADFTEVINALSRATLNQPQD